MNIFNNVSLADFSTMHLGGTAAHLTEVHTTTELTEACDWAAAQNLPIIVVGGGSNIVWRDEGFNGLIIVNRLLGYESFEADEQSIFVTVGAGENWDSVVERTVEAGLTGIEALSLIPGTAGATPVQNVGAYGQEISQVLSLLQAYDTLSRQLVTIPAADCGFGYRTSRFKTTDRGRYIITSLTLNLRRGSLEPPFYSVLENYLQQNSITASDPATIRSAVVAIRSARLPDPAIVANNGSFFANPIISQTQLSFIQDSSAISVPCWPTDDGRYKIPAAWLIEQAGFKDVHDSETGMATWHAQPLVLVNEAAQSTAQLLAFKQKIVSAVEQRFQVRLEQEPELLPA